MHERPAIFIRNAVDRDMDVMIALLHDLFSIEEDFHVDPEKQRRGLAMLIQNRDGACCKVAVDDVRGCVVGMCTAQTLISTAEGGIVAIVEDVVVEKNYRGQGIGARLMRTLADWAEKRGITRLQLLYDMENIPALSFYRKLGWQPTHLGCLRLTIRPGEAF